QQFAEISLNEVDAAKIKVGQKATLTFDAIEDLSIAGQVAEVDAIGTVSQGVVTYNVKVAFDTQDDRVKGGMTANAAVIIDMKTNILSVPSAAVKTQGEQTYVQILEGTTGEKNNQGVTSKNTPSQQIVETGISNDTLVEIVSGLHEGDQVVVRTTNTSVAQTSAAPSLFGAPSARNTGGAVRTTTR
ncbi:MAG: HlyD family efflux transporter periplasmic adaptor subunit, partial [Patescibacteria group bacterium]